MVMTPALTTVCANAIILVVFGNSWVANEVFTRFLVIRVAIAALKIIDNID